MVLFGMAGRGPRSAYSAQRDAITWPRLKGVRAWCKYWGGWAPAFCWAGWRHCFGKRFREGEDISHVYLLIGGGGTVQFLRARGPPAGDEFNVLLIHILPSSLLRDTTQSDSSRDDRRGTKQEMGFEREGPYHIGETPIRARAGGNPGDRWGPRQIFERQRRVAARTQTTCKLPANHHKTRAKQRAPPNGIVNAENATTDPVVECFS